LLYSSGCNLLEYRMSEIYVSRYDEIPNPGSFNDFTERTGLGGEQAIAGYSMILHEYRVALAAARGITLEDLHKVN
jgi:hypothetical protein